MNILMINYEWPPLGGGGGVAMCDVAMELAQHHRVHVVTSGIDGLPEEEISNEGDLTVFRCNALMRKSKSVASIPSMLSFYPAGVRLGRKLIQRFQYDVVNTWFAIPSGPTGVRVARDGGLPHLLTIIGGDIFDPSKWYSPHRNPVLGRVVRSVLRHADRHTAISSDIARRAREHFGFERPIDVIGLGIKQPQFKQSSRESLGLKPKGKYIISVGRLIRRKNYPAVLRAFSMLDRRDVELLIVGDGPELGNLRELASSLDITGQVQFRGHVSDETKFQLLSNSDIFALPSHHEGFGLVYLEAMFCGLPVVASSTGGQCDFLVDGETGYLVSPDDIGGISSSLKKLIDGNSLRISLNNSELVKSYFVSQTAKRYEQLMQETCGITAALPEEGVPVSKPVMRT